MFVQLYQCKTVYYTHITAWLYFTGKAKVHIPKVKLYSGVSSSSITDVDSASSSSHGASKGFLRCIHLGLVSSVTLSVPPPPVLE
jgi:hypothetical protein